MTTIFVAYPTASRTLSVWQCRWHHPLSIKGDCIHHWWCLAHPLILLKIQPTRAAWYHQDKTHSQCSDFHTFWTHSYSWLILTHLGLFGLRLRRCFLSIKSQNYALKISTGYSKKECSLGFKLLPKSPKCFPHSCCQQWAFKGNRTCLLHLG